MVSSKKKTKKGKQKKWLARLKLAGLCVVIIKEIINLINYFLNAM